MNKLVPFEYIFKDNNKTTKTFKYSIYNYKIYLFNNYNLLWGEERLTKSENYLLIDNNNCFNTYKTLYIMTIII